MAVRNDLNRYKEQREKIKKTAVMTAKITVIVLAALFVLTTVMVIVDMTGVNEGSYTAGGGEGDGGSSAPTITVPTADGKLYLYVGENVSWRNLVRIPDGCTLSVDSSGVNIDKAGIYEVKYTATSASGKSVSKTVTVVVTKKEYSFATMQSLFEKKAADLGITSQMSKQEQVRAVYNYVNDPNAEPKKANIVFNNESNSSRNDWENDWIEEAIRTLTSGQGDCYSYYSVSKAFFTVLGIEHIGIQRDENVQASGTHFWLMVNIGTDKSEQWYYYDATRLAGHFGNDTTDKDGCFMTLAKMKSYVPNKQSEKDFYKFTPTEDMPAAATKEVN